MSSTRARRQLAAALVTVLSLALVGCSDDAPDTGPGQGTSSTEDASGMPVPPDLDEAFTTTLDERASALRDHDRRRFLGGIERTDPGFVVAQKGYFDNLAQLPLRRFNYDLDRSSMVRVGEEYWVVVEVTTQLEGFDPRPVVSHDRFRFSSGKEEGYVVSSVTDPEWEHAHRGEAQPWDMVPIHVQSRPGVLGIFDDESIAAAEPLMDSIEQGITDISGVVPYDWSRSVVVYALSDTDFLASLDDLPGGDPENLDGVAFPVMADEPGVVVATRFALHPSMLEHPGLDRDRLVRHELTHVALGERDDRAPAWLSEGIAEWVSVQALAPELRRLPQEALGAAEAGVHGLPRDGTFNDDVDSSAHYGLSWWACEYLVASFGETSLWQLLEELGPEVDQDAKLESLIGINTRQLARRAARMMIHEYDPGFLPPEPSATPTDAPS